MSRSDLCNSLLFFPTRSFKIARSPGRGGQRRPRGGLRALCAQSSSAGSCILEQPAVRSPAPCVHFAPCVPRFSDPGLPPGAVLGTSPGCSAPDAEYPRLSGPGASQAFPGGLSLTQGAELGAAPQSRWEKEQRPRSGPGRRGSRESSPALSSRDSICSWRFTAGRPPRSVLPSGMVVARQSALRGRKPIVMLIVLS